MQAEARARVAGARSVAAEWVSLPCASRVFALVVFVVMAGPAATNVSPGMVGYLFTAVILALTVLWLAERARDIRTCSGLGGLGASGIAVFLAWITLGLVRAEGHWDLTVVVTTLVVLCCACPWMLVRQLPGHARVATVALVSAAGVLGSAVASVVQVLATGQVWLDRPGLPIGGASNNGLGLALLLAGVLVGARRSLPDQRWVWWLLVALDLMMVAQSLSRAGWVLGALVLLGAARLHGGWRWTWLAGALVPAFVVGGGLLAQGRGTAFFTSRRGDNVTNSLDAWANSLTSVVAGTGPMRVWPWLASERTWDRQGIRGTIWTESEWGDLLYHSHSTYLALLVEYGMVGLALFALVGFLIVRAATGAIRRDDPLALIAWVLLLSFPAMLFELYLLRGFPTALLWWTAMFFVIRGDASDASGRPRSP